MSNKKHKRLPTIMLSCIMAASLLPMTAKAADNPTPVDGRILETEKTGDSSDWIEIARYEDYSLILRQKPLTDSLSKYNNSQKNNLYTDSLARKSINEWYNNKLHGSARLRDFAVKSDAMRVIGTIGTRHVDGISLPSGTSARTGEDVAFALSYCEAAFYCSTQYSQTLSDGVLYPSSTVAKNNYAKLLPKYTGAIVSPAYWLRTPGNLYYAAGCVAYTGGNSDSSYGRAYQHTVIGEYAHYRPAIWVGAGIFGDGGRTVAGKVWPMLAEDIWGLGADFIRGHDVAVELRSTFLTPAPPEFCATATLMGDNGLGVFTFENVPAGDYILYIKRPGYLTRTMPFTISAGDPGKIELSPPGKTDNGVFNLWWGDCNDDGRVDNDDVMMILELMSINVNAHHPYYNPACDMNGDGLIDNEDIQMALEMWDRMILDYPGSEGVNPFN